MKSVYTLQDLQNWREVADDVDPLIRLGVFGDPVAHSLSPQMQTAALKHANIDMQYAGFQIRAGDLDAALQLVREGDFSGLNLTIPHKIPASDLMDWLDEPAKRIRAV